MIKYVSYIENPGFDRSKLEFGITDPEFAEKVISLIPDEWMKSNIHKSSLTGRISINLRHHDGIVLEIVDIIKGMEDHGEVRVTEQKFKETSILNSYLIN